MDETRTDASEFHGWYPPAWASPDPEPSADLEPEEAPGRYEISGLGTGRLEAIFAEGEDLRGVPSAQVIAEERREVDVSDLVDIPDQWKFTNRSHGRRRDGRAGKRSQPGTTEPRPRPVTPAARVDAPAPRAKTLAPRVDASAPHPTRRRGEVGKHRKRRHRGHLPGKDIPRSEGCGEDELHLPVGRLRGGLVGAAVRVLGVTLPLVAATMAYLSHVR